MRVLRRALGALVLLAATPLLLLVSGQVSQREMTGLQALYQSTKGDFWSWTNESVVWNFTQDSSGRFVHNPCSSQWEGLSCSNIRSDLCAIQPCEITRIHLPAFNLTGSLPSEIGLLTAVNYIDMSLNSLRGPIPSEIGNVVLLDILSFQYNQLSGPIPNEISNLVFLTSIDTESNRLTGTLPRDLSRLVRLVSLDLAVNLLTGPMPANMGNLKSLRLISFRHNLLSGSIPADISNMPVLGLLHLSNNFLTGTISPQFGNFSRLNNLDLDQNGLTGSLPSELGGLVQLISFTIAGCQLTGNIPPELGFLNFLEMIDFQSNDLSGQLPTELSKMTNMFYLNFHDNQLSGTLPSLANMEKLESAFFHNNAFTGSIDHVFNASSQRLLTIVDFSSNLLSDRVPDSLFLLPAIKVLALSANCFHDQLHDVMCAATHVEVMSLNGLGAAEGCRRGFKVPISDVLLFNTIGGTVPACLWHLRNLTVLHLAGNGLTGELIPKLPSYSPIRDLRLSHNRLSGSVPNGVHAIQKIDLSYNQFSGKYEDAEIDFFFMKLDINRLSGQLPVSKMQNVSDLNILRGNMFSCDTIPGNDKFVEDYICGSDDLNDSLYVLGSMLLLIAWIAFVVYLAVASSKFDSTKRIVVLSLIKASITKLSSSFTYFNDSKRQAGNVTLLKIRNLHKQFKKTIQLTVELSFAMLVVMLPVYMIKSFDTDGIYMTHTSTYMWFYTLAYMQGVVPSCLLMVSWIVLISLCYYRIVLCPSVERGSPSLHGNEIELKNTPLSVCSVTWVVVSLVLNIAITITVNALYIYSTQQGLHEYIHFGIQFSLAVFRMVYAYWIFPYVTRPIVDPIAKISYRLRLLVVNNFIIPCLTTAFTSPACFQGLILSADAINTPYTYRECLLVMPTWDGGICVFYQYFRVDTVTLIPPFTYSNQCASVLLTSYIPVLILGLSMQIALCFTLPSVVSWLGGQVSLEFLVGHKAVSGLMCPEFWLGPDNHALVSRNRARVDADSTTVFNPKTILCSFLNNLMILLTFGLCSPILAAALTFCVILQMNMWVLLLGRFASVLGNFDDENNNKHFALIALSKVSFPMREVFRRSFWLIAWCSGIFCAMVCWDIAADDLGWAKSLWIPILTLTYPVILWVVSRCIEHKCCPDPEIAIAGGKKNNYGGSRETELVSVGSSHNPLHKVY